MKSKEFIIEGFLSSTGDELPDTIYHGTTLNNWEEIKKTGLDPSKTDERDDPELHAGFTFFSWSVRGAERFAPGGEYNTSPDEGVILAVKLNPKLASKMRTDLGEFIRCPVFIPAKDITVVKHTNVPGNIDEASPSQKYSVLTRMANKAGYTLIGQGKDARVYKKKGARGVVKILIGEKFRKPSQAAAGLLRFVEFCKENPNIPYLPKFGKVQVMPINNEKIYHITMEELQLLSEDESQVAFSMEYIASKNGTFKDVIDDIRKENKENTYDPEAVIREEQIALKNKQVFEVLQKLQKYSDRFNVTTDFFNEESKNIMKRKDGTWVINDPFAY